MAARSSRGAGSRASHSGPRSSRGSSRPSGPSGPQAGPSGCPPSVLSASLPCRVRLGTTTARPSAGDRGQAGRAVFQSARFEEATARLGRSGERLLSLPAAGRQGLRLLRHGSAFCVTFPVRSDTADATRELSGIPPRHHTSGIPSRDRPGSCVACTLENDA